MTERSQVHHTPLESVRKKMKDELRCYEKIPVWICEYHQEVLPYIYRAIGSRHLPFLGITMLHFDSHPDLMAPTELKADCARDKDLLFDVLSIADWILPAVYVGHIKKVIWIKPPWSNQIADKTIAFHVGKHKTDGTIRVSCYEKYFCEDGLYAPLEQLENHKEFILVVMTMHFDCLPCNDPSEASSPNICSTADTLCSKEDHHGNVEQKHDIDFCTKCLPEHAKDCDAHKKTTLRDTGNLQEFIHGLSMQLEEPFILDIDMDFFSTLNPFQMMFTKDMDEASQKHQQNVKNLQATLNFLKNGTNSETEDQVQAINVVFMEFIKKWKESCSEPVDYEMVHSAGMTIELPVHISNKQEIIKMINHLQKVLTSIPKPTIVTVARSSDDDYTPPDSVEFIQTLLIKCLRDSYEENVEYFLTYNDD